MKKQKRKSDPRKIIIPNDLRKQFQLALSLHTKIKGYTERLLTNSRRFHGQQERWAKENLIQTLSTTLYCLKNQAPDLWSKAMSEIKSRKEETVSA